MGFIQLPKNDPETVNVRFFRVFKALEDLGRDPSGCTALSHRNVLFDPGQAEVSDLDGHVFVNLIFERKKEKRKRNSEIKKRNQVKIGKGKTKGNAHTRML